MEPGGRGPPGAMLVAAGRLLCEPGQVGRGGHPSAHRSPAQRRSFVRVFIVLFCKSPTHQNGPSVVLELHQGVRVHGLHLRGMSVISLGFVLHSLFSPFQKDQEFVQAAANYDSAWKLCKHRNPAIGWLDIESSFSQRFFVLLISENLRTSTSVYTYTHHTFAMHVLGYKLAYNYFKCHRLFECIEVLVHSYLLVARNSCSENRKLRPFFRSIPKRKIGKFRFRVAILVPAHH